MTKLATDFQNKMLRVAILKIKKSSLDLKVANFIKFPFKYKKWLYPNSNAG